MLSKVKKPTFLIDKKKCLRNIELMMERIVYTDIKLRPHAKTHQNCEIASWFKDFSVERITVSSIDMAKQFLECGFTDITIAIPVNIRQMNEIEELCSRADLGLLVENLSVVKLLGERKLKCKIWIEINCGHNRTGISWKDIYSIGEILDEISYSRSMKPAGFLTHSGNTYKAKSLDQVELIYRNAVKRMDDLREHFRPLYPHLEISVGDTPGCVTTDELGNVDEIRPGNFVFFDVMQLTMGICSEEQIACAVACPVISIHPERKEMIVYCGAVHLSKDAVKQGESSFYGYVCPITENGWGARYMATYVSSLSQEHGIIKTTDYILEQIKIGDLVAILPVHSCLTADLHKSSTLILE